MHRVFPLRPSETSLLVSYHNGAFELDDSPADTSSSSSSSSCNLKGPSAPAFHRRCSSTNFSVTFLEDKGSPPVQPNTSHRFSPSTYPEFAEVASPSPPHSSLWTSSFRDDGDSASFNFSDGMHNHATSSLSTSSSSSVTCNSRSAASFSAIPSNKAVDATLDTAGSACKDVHSLVGTEIAACKDSISHHFEWPTAVVPSTKPPVRVSNTQAPNKRRTIHVAPGKVRRENLPAHVDSTTSHSISLCSVSSPKVAGRSLEILQHCSCLPRSRESSSSSRTMSTSPKSFRCSTPFKYLTKYLRTEKSSNTPQKERSTSFRARSPPKFSTLLNQLYSPASQTASPRVAREKEYIGEESLTGEDFQSGVSRSRVGGINALANDRCVTSDEDWQSPLKCHSFGAVMIGDYVRRTHEMGKSPSFRNAPKSSSFRHDSDAVSSKESKRSSSSIDLTSKRGKAASNRSCKMTSSGKYVDRKDHDKLPDLVAAEEKNTKNLALLRFEISKLCKDKRHLARELAAEMKARQCEQKATDRAIKKMEVTMEEKLITVEKDHAYVQACLEKEIDRRKKEWSAKLDKIRLEEKKLRERVTEMALERVELQKSIAFYKGREASMQSHAKGHELSAQAWMQRHQQSEEEALLLRQSFTTVCNKLGEKEHELDLALQRSKVLERENIELLKEFSRLRGVYAEQEMTFEKLWQRLLDIVNGPLDCKVNSLRRLHGELKSFSVREQALRYEIGVLQSQLFHTKRKNSSTEGLFSLDPPREQPSLSNMLSVQCKNDTTSETLDDLAKKLELAMQHMQRAEHQLKIKEEEVELLHATLKERDCAMQDLQEEFTLVKAQRDGLRKQVQQMGHEALDLTLELSELRKVVEKMDDELMLKEGQISILRESYSDSDF